MWCLKSQTLRYQCAYIRVVFCQNHSLRRTVSRILGPISPPSRWAGLDSIIPEVAKSLMHQAWVWEANEQGLVRGLACSLHVPQLLLCFPRTILIVKPVSAFICGVIGNSKLLHWQVISVRQSLTSGGRSAILFVHLGGEANFAAGFPTRLQSSLPARLSR